MTGLEIVILMLISFAVGFMVSPVVDRLDDEWNELQEFRKSKGKGS